MRKLLIIVALLAIAGAIVYIRAQTTTKHETPIIPTENSTTNLNVYFFDVGQGDCILIDYGEYECLVDSGDGSTDIVNLMDAYINGPIEDIVATHPHADHIGGFPSIFERYEVLNCWSNGETATTNVYNNMMSAVSAETGISVHNATKGDIITSDNIIIEVIKSSETQIDTNNDSVVLKVTYGETSYLLMGDTEQEGENAVLADPSVYHMDVLKIGHHGSCTSSSYKFLHLVTPKIAVYCAGMGNQYGHPCPEVLQRLSRASVYGTDVNGTIRVSSDGERCFAYPERS